MPVSVLVAYATRGGSTAEVAHAIGTGLRESGLTADVAPVAEVKSLMGKTAVIVGAPLYMGRFPKEFHAFLRLHREELAELQLWVFVLGPIRNRPEDFTVARSQADKQLKKYGWLHPADLEVFGGRWDTKGMPFPFSLALHIPGNPVGRIPASDVRDWTSIYAWARSVARRFQPVA